MLSLLPLLPVAAFPPPAPRGKGDLRGAGGLGLGNPPVVVAAAAAALVEERGRERGRASSPLLGRLDGGRDKPISQQQCIAISSNMMQVGTVRSPDYYYEGLRNIVV